MKALSYFAFTILCSLSFPPCLLSIQCNERQYGWPEAEPQICCNMCKPGEYLKKRRDGCQTECAPCEGKRYTNHYNVQLSCEFCKVCQRPNMEYVSHCNATHDAVCRCKAGYECREEPCKQCLPVPSTTKLPLTKPPFYRDTAVLKPRAPTTPATPKANMEHISDCNATHDAVCRCKAGYECREEPCKQCLPVPPTTKLPLTTPPFYRHTDALWFLVIIGLLFVVIALSVAANIRKSFLHWIRCKYGYLLAKTHAPVTPCSEDEEVSKPIQEAGTVTNLKIDPELGLVVISQVQV